LTGKKANAGDSREKKELKKVRGTGSRSRPRTDRNKSVQGRNKLSAPKGTKERRKSRGKSCQKTAEWKRDSRRGKVMQSRKRGTCKKVHELMEGREIDPASDECFGRQATGEGRHRGKRRTKIHLSNDGKVVRRRAEEQKKKSGHIRKGRAEALRIQRPNLKGL